jgi:hypothetical protein
MSIDDPSVPSPSSGGVGVPPSRPSLSDGKLALVEKAKRQGRPTLDPFNLTEALARLDQLLALDADVPRLNVPRGFYLDILV